MTTSYAFDNGNRLTRLSHTTGGGSVTLGDYQFGLDTVGNRTAITETVQVPGMGGAMRVVSYTLQVVLPFVANQAPRALPTVQSTQYPILLPFVSNGGVSPSEQRRVVPLDPAGREPVRAPTAALPTPNKTAAPQTAAPKTAAPGEARVPTRALVPAQTATPTDQRRVGEVANPREQVRGGVLPRVMSSVTETTTSYSYDPLSRVTGASYTGGLTHSYGYAYDAVGNRTVQTQTITSTLVTNYGYDIANRLTNVNGQPYTWDDNGNLLNDGAQTYTYDQANRLKTAVGGAITTTFAYNGVGDRLSQTVGITTTRYVLDPAAGLTQVLADGTNTYLYGNARLGQYQASMQYFGADGLGSVRQIYDSSGQVVGSSRYDPYGSLMAQSGATSVFGFTGEQQDATGLTYLRARYYSSAQGRFTTRDVWEGDPNAPMSYNAWNYTSGNPVNLTDPSGRAPISPPGGLGARGCPDALGQDQCEKLAQRIAQRVALLETKYYDAVFDKYKLPDYGKMSKEGHMKRFQAEQAALQRDLRDWDYWDCNNRPGPGLPAGAEEWAQKPYPNPPLDLPLGFWLRNPEFRPYAVPGVAPAPAESPFPWLPLPNIPNLPLFPEWIPVYQPAPVPVM